MKEIMENFKAGSKIRKLSAEKLRDILMSTALFLGGVDLVYCILTRTPTWDLFSIILFLISSLMLAMSILLEEVILYSSQGMKGMRLFLRIMWDIVRLAIWMAFWN